MTKKRAKTKRNDEPKRKQGVRSIYIPDDLWREARIEAASAIPTKTISQIIREELEDRYARRRQAAARASGT